MFSKHFGFPFYIAAVAVTCISLSAVAGHVQGGQKDLSRRIYNKAAADALAAEAAGAQSADRDSSEAVNKKPLKDWLREVKEANDRGELNLSVPTEIVIEADRTARGELTAPVVLKKQGDSKVALYFASFVSALSDSRVLQIFRDADRLRFMFNLTEAEVRLAVSFEAPTAERAGQMATAYNRLFSAGRVIKKDTPENLFYENAKASSSEKEVLFSLTLQHKDALTLLNKLLTD